MVFGTGPVDGVLDRLRGLVHVKLVDPELAGPTRRRLASPEAIWLIADTIADQLPEQLARHPELEADLRTRVPTRQAVADGTYVGDAPRRRRNTPI